MDFVLKLGYFIAALTFIVGFKFLSSPTRSKLGNSIAALGMSLAALLTIIAYFSDSVLSINFTLILVAIIIGTIVGKIMSDKVEMTKMPQLI